MRAYFELALRILTSITTISRIQGKLLAATIDNDAEGIRVQEAAYAALRRRLTLSAAYLPDTAAEARAIVERDDRFAIETRRAILQRWHAEGVPQEVRDAWMAASGTAERLTSIEAQLRAEFPIDQPLGVMLRQAADLLVHLAREAETNNAAFLVSLHTTPG
jgi:hypothetical protein